jgi:Na+-transporting methylmalonyl-CoA/oxaloacetate decarboxylase gamma subunit
MTSTIYLQILLLGLVMLLTSLLILVVLTNKRYFNRCIKWCYMWLDAFKFPRAPPTKSETKPRASKRRKQHDEEEDELC